MCWGSIRSAIACCTASGAYDEFVAASETMDDYVVAGGNGRIIKTFDFRPFTRAYGQIRILGRGDLLRLLHRAAEAPEVRMGVTISAMTEMDDTVRVRTSDGVEREYDLVVGADGIHSQTRKQVSPDNAAFDTDWACWAWWAERGGLPADTVYEQWGAGRFVGVYPTPSRIGVIAAAPARVLGFGAKDGRQGRMMEEFVTMKGRARDADRFLPGRFRRDVLLEARRPARQRLDQGAHRAARRFGLRLPADGGNRRIDGDGIGGRAGATSFRARARTTSRLRSASSRRADARASRPHRTTAASFPS